MGGGGQTFSLINREEKRKRRELGKPKAANVYLHRFSAISLSVSLASLVARETRERVTKGRLFVNF